jgi:hypothetical protein
VNSHKHLVEYVERVLTKRWKDAGEKPDTTMEIERQRGSHWLLVSVPTRPSISTFLRAVLRHHKWTQTDMSKRVGMNVVSINRLVTGGQQSCAPETKSKFKRLVTDVPHLLDVFEATDWGLSAEPNRALAQEKKRRR